MANTLVYDVCYADQGKALPLKPDLDRGWRKRNQRLRVP